LYEPSVNLGAGADIETPTPADTIEALLTAAVVMEVEQWPGRPFDWRMPFLDCLIRYELPED